MVRITDTIRSCLEFLKKVKELEDREPSILEIGKSLGWNYPKTNNIARALKELGLYRNRIISGYATKIYS